jgi:hypothetical protein
MNTVKWKDLLSLSSSTTRDAHPFAQFCERVGRNTIREPRNPKQQI